MITIIALANTCIMSSNYCFFLVGSNLAIFLVTPCSMRNLPQLGIEAVPPALEAQSLNYWTARNVTF